MVDEKKLELMKKLQALAERGVGGEKEGAQRKLEELMKKYNIEEEDLSDDKLEDFEFKYRTLFEEKLLRQLFYKIVPDYRSKTYRYSWGRGSKGYEDVEGFYYHEITEECKAEGGSFPVIAQVYTYIVCKNAGVDYEVVFALIEQESSCVWNASGDSGKSIGLMQVAEKWHKDRMERLGCTDMTNPYQNIMVGVDFLAELLKEVEQEDKQLQYADALAAYNYGMTGAKKHLWDNGIHWYSYNTEIMRRAEELKQERVNALEKRGRSVEE